MLSRSSYGCGRCLLHHLKQAYPLHTPQILVKNSGSVSVCNESQNLIHYSKSVDQNKSHLVSDEENVSPYVTEEPPVLKTKGVIPGKGPPPEPPVDCCMSGCVNCVWIAYAESLKEYYTDGGKAARDALEQIENPSLKMFVKLEMGLL